MSVVSSYFLAYIVVKKAEIQYISISLEIGAAKETAIY